MYVYYKGKSKNHTLHVTPGVDCPENSEWFEADKSPKKFAIHFVNHRAEVEDGLGKYLIDKGYASKSRIIIPDNNIEVA